MGCAASAADLVKVAMRARNPRSRREDTRVALKAAAASAPNHAKGQHIICSENVLSGAVAFVWLADLVDSSMLGYEDGDGMRHPLF